MADSDISSRFSAILDKCRPELSSYEKLYKHFHQSPELSTAEYETASSIAAHLGKLSPNGELTIRDNIGGLGIIAICKNGPGPTILLRADIDGMPVKEQTGLAYSSTKTQSDNLDGQTKRVMHACGHDFHFTSLLAATETMLAAKGVWSGTVVFLFQPAEERGIGAKRMVEDGLYDPDRHACPIPDSAPGSVQTKPGPFFSAADSYKITVYGRGGHGSMPHKCVDPVVAASHIIVRLQTIVSREVPPDETAVITVGSLQSGHTVNVISDEAVLQVNIRSVSEKWRKVILQAVKRVVNAECTASRCPHPARFEKLNDYPLTNNDGEATRRIQESFDEHFGKDHERTSKGFLASEDFSTLATTVGRPYVYWTFGGIDHQTWDKHEKNDTIDEIPANHSPLFAPAIQPTLRTGVDAMVVAALTFLGNSR
ncbi:hypothetical protein LTR41_011227 [Exophiala xenobiotica]|nr:hypothetical protein LTR41_011227 [Exophiala xenobiotica]KAK5550943.1 hypothetical protein LTR46_011052 [Exophiala xenobiotica]